MLYVNLWKFPRLCDFFRWKGHTQMVSSSSATAPASSGNGSSSPPFPEMDAMMVDHHRGGSGSVNGSRELGSGGVVSAAVAAVVSTMPAHAGRHDMASLPIHRVLSAPLLSPNPANSEGTRSREGRRSGGLHHNQPRLPSLRQVLRLNPTSPLRVYSVFLHY